MKYQHSPVAMALRHDVLESQVMLQYSLAYMNATASIHANAKADIDKGCTSVNKMYTHALHLVPYLTAGKPEGQNDTLERNKLVAEFKRMQRQELDNGGKR
jgi:hypothetical protein